jgi:hypothetical protein
VPNPNPNLKNLTRAGMGRPCKNLQRISLTLTPELLEKIDAIATWKECHRNYLIEQILRVAIALPADYSQFELEQILAQRDEFQDL